MKRVAAMSDTVTYLPEQLVKENDITLVSTHVIVDGKSNRENEIDLDWFYQQMPKWKNEDKLPTTSSPSTDDFLGIPPAEPAGREHCLHRLQQQAGHGGKRFLTSQGANQGRTAQAPDRDS
jgi:hypothetical protein